MAGLFDTKRPLGSIFGTPPRATFLESASAKVDLKLRVWTKGQVIPGRDPKVWRRDDYGYMIKYDDYGDRNSSYGWEIDHIQPGALGGSDAITNLRPLCWLANARLGGALSGLLGGR